MNASTNSPESAVRRSADGRVVTGPLALRHGATSSLTLGPRAVEIADELARIVPAATEADEPAVKLLALQLARIERASQWLDEHGLVGNGGEPQPILRTLSTWENSAARLCDRLGLTPRGRAELGLTVASAADTLSRRAPAVEYDLSGLDATELATLRDLLAKTLGGAA